MNSPLSSLGRGGATSPSVFAAAFRQQIRAIESNTMRYRVPRIRHLYEAHPRMQYHFKPELFVQLGGVTEFTMPEETIELLPGEICIMPKGMPHGEFVHGGREPFENVVVSYYDGMVDIHVAHEALPGWPRADAVYLYSSDLYDDQVSYLDRVCEFHHSNRQIGAAAIKGLLLTEFSILLALVESQAAHQPSTTDTIELCQWLIQHNLQEPDLSVQTLAAEIGCSPNYLSKLFHRRAGERITERINRLRVQNASDALARTRHSVKSIAAACGFSDPNYFARVFRQATGRSPQQYRAEQHRYARVAGAEPTVVPPFHTDDPEPSLELIRDLVFASATPAGGGERVS